MLLLLSSLACNGDSCIEGFGLGPDGNCYPLDDTGLDSGGCEAVEGTPPTDSTPPLMSLADSTIVLCGGARGARMGRHVAGAGDVDGDGRADLLLGADRSDGLNGEPWAGATILVLASSLPDSGSFDTSKATATWHGEGENDLAGHSAVAAGDIDGDGTPELAIAGYHADHRGSDQGRVYIVQSDVTGSNRLGDADRILGGTQDHDRLGHGLALAGDVDGDGLSDLIMGACCGDPDDPGPGRAWLVLGSSLGGNEQLIELSEHTPLWTGETDDDHAGFKTGSAGDVDGDGLDDFVVSASLQGVEFAEEGGRVYLLLGTNVDPDLVGELADADAVLVGSYAGGQFGYDTGPAGDVDGDGLDDLAIGANQAGQGGFLTGEAYIFLGSTMAGGELSDVDADLRFTSFQEKHLLGSSIEGDMDLDGDGRPELVLGAPGLAPPTLWKPEADPVVPEGMDSPGDVYLYWGTDLQPGVHDVTQASVHLTGTQLNEHAGIRVTSPGDVDGDGHDDLFIGTERGGLDPDAPGQMGVGQAYLLIGLHP